MIEFSKFQLKNGLRVIVHEDDATPMAVVNVLYNVGARDENPEKTGFAHLFEHLMFGGSLHIPHFDEPLQLAGGENNAYTTNDLTNYYCQLPAQNIETAFWLESDRMLSLAFSQQSLDVQKKVVCEEFKEHYINKPYGDAWKLLREMAYTQHPYRWMTIGKDLAHIENATLQNVKDFFYKFYRPNNAILVVAGNVKTDDIKHLAEKWFGDIEPGEPYVRALPKEPKQTVAKVKEVYADVPVDAIYKVWHIGNRLDKTYYVADLITDILGAGASSRLYQKLVKEKQLLSAVSCYHLGSIDEGLIVVQGRLLKGVDMQAANEAIDSVMDSLVSEKMNEKELQKVKNKTESLIHFEDMSIMNRANSLAFYELLGDAALMNEELQKYQAVSVDDIGQFAQQVFVPENSCTLKYFAKK